MHKPITPEDYQNFRLFLEESCGIVLGENKHYLVNSRLNRIMDEVGYDSLGSLIGALKREHPRGLRERIVDAMTTNETYWFRDAFPFEILKRTILPELNRAKQQSVRIWSAACSSGQEPYSISMSFHEYQMANPGALPKELQVVATDISPSMLADSKRGVYDNLAISRGLSDERKQRYFQPLDRNRWEVRPQLRQSISFREHNLMQSYALLGRFDIIFCRNVLIYFSPESKLDILERMARVLNPGGYLFLGASESITSYSSAFDMIRCNPGVVYRLKADFGKRS